MKAEFMSRKILTISNSSVNGIDYQVLYIRSDAGTAVPVWSRRDRHIFKVGDNVYLGIYDKKGQARLHVVFPEESYDEQGGDYSSE